MGHRQAKERLEALRKESGLPLRVLEGDLLKETVFEQLEDLEREYAGNCMLANALDLKRTGDDFYRGYEDPDGDDPAELRSVDPDGGICMQYFSKGSRIINLSSAAAFCPQPKFPGLRRQNLMYRFFQMGAN